MNVDVADLVEPIRLLLVDDDADFLEMLGDLLRVDGHMVTTASNLENALQACSSQPQDVVITDLHMPGGSGVSLFQQLKTRSIELPIIIFLTGMPDVSLRTTYLQGADAVLKKPVSPKELSDIVKYMFIKRQTQEKSKADLNDLRERLASVDKLVSLGIMASEIAHEIKGSLTIIQGNNQLLKSVQTAEPKEQQRVEHYTRRIEEAILRISKIIREVQRLSGEDATEPHQVLAVRTLTQDVLALCGDYLRSKNVTRTVDEIPESLCINGSSIQLSQLLVNLIQNACDAIEKLPERWLHLGCRENADQVILTVTDSGPGIPAEFHEQIFRPFFTTKPAGKGTGLGLSIATKIVQAHGGKIAIDGTCANTRFILTFPRIKKDQSE